LTNPFSTSLQTTLRWKTFPGWRIDQQELAVSAAPGGAASMKTRIQTDGPVCFPTPVLQGTIDDPETGKPIELKYALNVMPRYDAPYVSAGVVLDGDLSEWANAQELPLLYGANYDPADISDLKVSTRLMWDEGNLYVAVEVEDNEFYQPYSGDVVWMADSVELWIEKSNWSFSLTPKGPQVFLDERPDKHLDAVVKEVPLAAVRSGNRVVYEAAYPAAEVPHIRLEAGSGVHFSLLVNDLDPSGPLEKRHYAELTPGAGEHFNCPVFLVNLAEK
jgi:hypothetical protein